MATTSGVGPFPGWEIKTCIGSGSFGLVLKALSLLENKEYALKVIQVNPEKEKKQEREFKISLSLNHPNLLKTLSANRTEIGSHAYISFYPENGNVCPFLAKATLLKKVVNIFCIQMELCGENLRSWLQQSPNRSEKEVQTLQLSIMTGVIEGVEYLHGQNIIHRDLKPENILFSGNNYRLPVKIGDYGLCRVLSESQLSDLTSSVGTRSYRAPEIPSKTYSFESDIFSLGLIIWEIIQFIPITNLRNYFDRLVFCNEASLVEPCPFTKDLFPILSNICNKIPTLRLQGLGKIKEVLAAAIEERRMEQRVERIEEIFGNQTPRPSHSFDDGLDPDVLMVPINEMIGLSTPSKFQLHQAWFSQAIQEDLRLIRQNQQPINFNISGYQIQAVLKTKRHFDDPNRPNCPALIVAPTGSGKSGMVAMLPYVLGSRKVLILSPSTIISEVLAKAFGHNIEIPSFFQKKVVNQPLPETWNGFLESLTIIQSSGDVLKQRMPNLVIGNAHKFGGQTNPSLINKRGVVVNDVATFFEQFDTLIVDEAHCYPAATWVTVVDQFLMGKKKIVFLSATPYRENGEDILPNQTTTFEIRREHVEGIYIRETVFLEIPTRSFTVPGKFESDRSFGNYLLNMIRESLSEHDQLQPTIQHQAMILTRLTNEVTSLVDMLNQLSGSPSFACAVIGDRNGKAFRDGTYRVAILSRILLEGFDNSNVSVCIILRKVGSPVLFSQFIGRCTRKSELGGAVDNVVAKVISFERFGQREMWDRRDRLAEEDPEEED